MQTEICITIDTEFSIGGAFADPVNCRPVGEEYVTCAANGKEQGLGFLLDLFERYSIGATFFVEALNPAYFGDAPMGRIVERIMRAKQDVQLHLHPVWLYFQQSDWAAQLQRNPPTDRCDGRTIDEAAEVIEAGLSAFRRWGAPAPVALRTGSLRIDMNVYAAMERVGVPLSSSIGAAYFRPEAETLRLDGGRHWIGKILEVPVLSYTQLSLGPRRLQRLLTITACSFAEMKGLLWQARAAGISPVVILTHPFEFIKGHDEDIGDAAPNRINKSRIERLCRFIAEHPRDFSAVRFRDSGPAWLEESAVPAPRLKAPLGAVFRRAIENKMNDAIRAF